LKVLLLRLRRFPKALGICLAEQQVGGFARVRPALLRAQPAPDALAGLLPEKPEHVIERSLDHAGYAASRSKW
jgi:hypothetical protein